MEIGTHMAQALDIVDDSAAIRKILQRVLQQAEIPLGSVYEAGDGVEALAVLKDKPVRLIFSEMLPGYSL
jgi:CheY-like chemotaxis protein